MAQAVAEVGKEATAATKSHERVKRGGKTKAWNKK
jgi:hypothetical protein